MKNIDLETFYGRAKTSLEIACSYIGISSFTKFIISCRLKPITAFDGTFKDGRLETWWVDEFGNSLYLIGNSPQIVHNDPKIKFDTKISTDLFYGRSILETAKISKTVIVLSHFIFFYGEDEYFRCFDIDTGSKVSPLDVGGAVDLIQTILNYANYKYKNINPDFIIYGLPNAEIETILKKEYSRYE